MATTQDLLNDLERFERTPAGRGYDLRLSLADLILHGLRAKGWTQKRLAEEAGMKEPYINRLIHARQNCTFDVAGRILFALGIKAEFVETPPRQSGKTAIPKRRARQPGS